MPGGFYKGLGLVVWKGGRWYLQRRYGASKRLGRGVLGVALLGAAAAAAARRRIR